MISVIRFSGQVENVRRISFVPSNPIGDVFSKAATNPRIESNYIVFSEMF